MPWKIYIPDEGHWPIDYSGPDIGEAIKAYLKWAERTDLPLGSSMVHFMDSWNTDLDQAPRDGTRVLIKYNHKGFEPGEKVSIAYFTESRHPKAIHPRAWRVEAPNGLNLSVTDDSLIAWMELPK